MHCVNRKQCFANFVFELPHSEKWGTKNTIKRMNRLFSFLAGRLTGQKHIFLSEKLAKGFFLHNLGDLSSNSLR